MAQSGVFSLLVRDERFDQFFTATEVLRDRIARLTKERRARGDCGLPPARELETSHRVFLRSDYKPFVNTASEYVKVRSTGSFAGLTAAGGSIEFHFPAYGNFTSDMFVHVRIGAVGSAADPCSAHFRYCAYPGLRLFSRVAFRSDEMLIDDYEADEAVAWAKYFVDPASQAGWERCVGQQEEKVAVAHNPTGHTVYYHYADGPQTFKNYQPPLDMFVPLQFWMCRAPASALANDLIPNSQRVVQIDLAPLTDIVQAVDGDGAPIPLPFTSLQVECTLYVDQLFVVPEVADLFASRLGFSLLHVHRRQRTAVDAPEGRVLQSQLKFPSEYIFLALRDPANERDFDFWCLNGRRRARGAANEIYAPIVRWQAGPPAMPQLTWRLCKEITTLEPIATTLGMHAHCNSLYPSGMLAGFFGAYAPLRYAGETRICTPRDQAQLIANFSLFPGGPDPSGYYNMSADRELYVSYRGAVGPGQPAQLVSALIALNLLVRDGDRVRLRYAL